MAEDAYVPGLVRWLIVVAVATTILVAAVVRPGQGVGQTGPFGLLTLDLWLHAVAYLLLELAAVYAVVGGRGPPVVAPTTTVVFVFAYGLLVETIQLGITYRRFSTADILANTVGALVALGLYYLVAWQLRREGLA